MYYTYIVECADRSLYTGYTTDVKARIRKHNSGKGAKYTRSHKPVKIVYKKEFGTKSEAQKEECRIKKLTRAKKLELIGNNAIKTNVTKM